MAKEKGSGEGEGGGSLECQSATGVIYAGRALRLGGSGGQAADTRKFVGVAAGGGGASCFFVRTLASEREYGVHACARGWCAITRGPADGRLGAATKADPGTECQRVAGRGGRQGVFRAPHTTTVYQTRLGNPEGLGGAGGGDWDRGPHTVSQSEMAGPACACAPCASAIGGPTPRREGTRECWVTENPHDCNNTM